MIIESVSDQVLHIKWQTVKVFTEDVAKALLENLTKYIAQALQSFQIELGSNLFSGKQWCIPDFKEYDHGL
jgi:hypothetical protein